MIERRVSRYETRNRAHKKFQCLPELQRQALGYYFLEQRRRSMILQKGWRSPGNEDIIELGVRILWHLHEHGPLPEITQETLDEIASRFKER